MPATSNPVGRYKAVAGCDREVTDVVESLDAAVGDDRAAAFEPEIIDDGRAQFLEAERRGIGAKLVGRDALRDRFTDCRGKWDVIGVLSHPAQVAIGEQ